MKKDQIDKKIEEIIQKKTINKVKRIGKNEDLYKTKIIDSFDMLTIIQEIETVFSIKIQVEKLKKFKFSINFLTNLIIKKIK
jgi:acyl carrier protein